MRTKRQYLFESLERRNLCSVSTLQDNDTIDIIGSDHNEFIEVSQTDNLTKVFIGGFDIGTFKDIKKINIRTGGGDDRIYLNTTDITTYVLGEDGNDFIQGGGGNDHLNGGNGDDIISNVSTDDNDNPIGLKNNDILIGGNGNDTIYGGYGARDYIFGGNGNDIIYDVDGGKNFIHGGSGDDWIITRFTDNIVRDSQDTKVVRFDEPKSELPRIIDGVLYVYGGGRIFINQFDGVVTLDHNNLHLQFEASIVRVIAALGDVTNDQFVNNSDILSFYDGRGGNDIILGGGETDILVGGMGDDLIDGREGNDHIYGGEGRDILLSRSTRAMGRDIVRLDGYDIVFADIEDNVITKLLSRRLANK
jgi:Ca2+-binding RTX toxin-like protein